MIHSEINEFILLFNEPTINEVIKINSNSFYKEEFNTFLEIKETLSNIFFVLKKDNKEIFNSKKNYINSLNINTVFEIFNKIKPYLYLSEIEQNNFKEICENYINGKTDKMPPELFIASNILNNNVSVSVKELENMPAIKYEKIEIAKKIILLTKE